MDDGKVTIFRTRQQQEIDTTQQDVVAELEGLLKRAQQGELVGLAYVTVSKDDFTGTGWTGLGRRDLSFGISLLNHRYHAACLEQPPQK